MGSTIRNVAWNFAGQGLPMVVALFTIPFLIRQLGTDRFGLLSIGWIAIGYLSIFDFGLGRAMTRQVAIRRGQGREADIPTVFWTALGAMALLGMVAAIGGVLLADAMATRLLRVPEDLQPEARLALMVLALGVPVTIVSTGLLGVLEAFAQFRRSGSLRMATGLATYVVPAVIAAWTRDIAIVVGGLVAARAVIAVVNYRICTWTVPNLGRPVRPDGHELRGLLQVGGWMTVSNTVSPLMAGLDRFFLGGLISVGAITYYVTPADALTKALVLPLAVTGVLFPAFAESMSRDPGRVGELYRRGWDLVYLVLLPFTLFVVAFARPALAVWIDADFAARSATIAVWIGFGVLANGLAQLPFWMLQATGRSRAVAFVHLAELPLYAVSLWVLVEWLGILGAAVAWTGRMTVDLVALLLVSGDALGNLRELVTPLWRPEAGLLVYAIVLAVLPLPLEGRAVGALAGAAVCGMMLLGRAGGLGGVMALAGLRASSGTGARL